MGDETHEYWAFVVLNILHRVESRASFAHSRWQSSCLSRDEPHSNVYILVMSYLTLEVKEPYFSFPSVELYPKESASGPHDLVNDRYMFET